MSDIFAEDDKFWDEGTAPVEHNYSPWSFDSNTFYIGNNGFILTTDDQHRASFELGLFDVHCTFLRSRSPTSHSHFYHTRLRSAVEAHFNDQTSTAFSCPAILQPWLWRTWFVCPHTADGRIAAAKYMSKYDIVTAGGQTPISQLYWIRSIKSPSPNGFRKYLPTWLPVVKETLGIPQQKNRLHCWQFDCFSSHFSASVTEPGIHFSHNPSFVFLSEEEKISMPWARLLQDPTIFRTSISHIDIEQLQRLIPGNEINCDIINMYHWECCSQQPKENKKAVVSTYFWPQVVLGKKGYQSANTIIHRALIDDKPPKAEGEKLTHIRAALADIETLLIPVNSNKDHWLLFIMDFKVKGWLFCDSASRVTGKKGRTLILKNIIDYFQDKLEFDCSTWSEIGALTVPQQDGGHDCGIYMCQFAKISLFKSYLDLPPKADVHDMLGWRRMMVLELVSGKIRWV